MLSEKKYLNYESYLFDMIRNALDIKRGLYEKYFIENIFNTYVVTGKRDNYEHFFINSDVSKLSFTILPKSF